MKKSENKKISAKKMITTIEKAAVKKTIKKKTKGVAKSTVKKTNKRKTKRVAKSTDPRMTKLQVLQKELNAEESRVTAEIKKEQQAIKSADAKCMSNAKNLNKHVMAIKAGIAEYSKTLKGATASNVVTAAEEKLIAKIQLSIDAVIVVRDLKFDVLRLIHGPDSSEEPTDEIDEFDL